MSVVIRQDGQVVVVRSRSDAVSVKSKQRAVHVKSAVLVDGVPYGGSYEVTPSEVQQVLGTASRTLADDVVVNPIPSNYGLITYDGTGITVS